MNDRHNEPQRDELSPQYDHYVDQALDYVHGHLLPEDAAEFRDRMKSDEMFRRVVVPVLEAHEGPQASPDSIREGWTDLRNRIVAAGGTPPSAEAIERALAEQSTTYEQRIRARARGNWRIIRRIAAVLAFLMLIPIGLASYVEVFRIARIRTGSNVTSTVRLPDQSLIQLQPDAFLRYPKNFGERRDRWVTFSGEGEFAISAGERRFRVETERADVLVIGTRFTLRASDDLTVVQVTEGTVSVQRRDRRGLTGQPVVIDAGTRVRVTQTGILTEANTKSGAIP